MSIRVSRSLALSLVVLAGAGCTDKAEQSNVAPFTRAIFDPGEPGVRPANIPTPNDLALQGAPGVTEPTTRGGLFALIDQGGFSATPAPTGLGQFSFIRFSYERVTDGVGSTPTVALDPATVNGDTVLIVVASGAGGRTRIPPAIVPTVGNQPGTLLLVPATGYTAGTRYVVAVRGGPNGVKTADGEELVAATPMALVTDMSVDFDDPDSRPASLSDEQAADLKLLRQVLTAPLDWNRAPPTGTDAAFCATALGIPAAAIPEGRCWLPTPSGGVVPAFDAIDDVFPVTEAVSIQAFEIAP